ncbi:52 kDa repressor of the inhibitor of the protein kinase-like [Sitophilus oryzae]|uniref:52 kDa repressor of the inhibitor of the protein kinase-like n=1 Tax=Sitophilus oryzae TaxID=7048 RepID=A0A6J2XKE5_SITOR|nr:52 kDa repressor of the inhibitor of the protein kinase-like [Sitophilus oryzae]
MRDNIDQVFSNIFEKAEKLLKSIDAQEHIQIPRIVAHQKNRSNIMVASPEEYFRITVAIPFLDDFIHQLTERFAKHKKSLSSLHCLLPNVCVVHKVDLEDLSLYKQFLDYDTLAAELDLWRQKWKQLIAVDRPKNAIETISECNQCIYPNIYILLKILATLPVSTATPERSFSTLRRLKDFLRNSTGQERLTGLALLSVHREINVDIEEVVNRFSREKTRNVQFIL